MTIHDRLKLLRDDYYREIVLRSRELLLYEPTSEAATWAESALFNLMVEVLTLLGMSQEEAEAYCDDSERLEVLARQIQVASLNANL